MYDKVKHAWILLVVVVAFVSREARALLAASVELALVVEVNLVQGLQRGHVFLKHLVLGLVDFTFDFCVLFG